MWCAILIFHVLVLRSFIQGFIWRDRSDKGMNQYFYITEVSIADQAWVRDNIGTDETGGPDCIAAY